MTDPTHISYLLSLISAIAIFAAIAWRNLPFALAILFGLLPTYLIRFHIGPLPTTFLEIMVWIVLIFWILKNWKRATKFVIPTEVNPDHIGMNEVEGSLHSPRLGRDDKYHPLISQFPNFLISQKKSLFLATTLFLLAATVSVFTSIHTRAALGEWKAFYVEPVLMFLVLITTIKTQKQINTLISYLLFSGLITSLLAIYQHFTGFMVPDAFWANRNTYRVTAWYGFPNAVGLFLAPLVPLAVYLAHEFKTKKNILISLFPYFFISSSIIAIIFAKSLGSLIAVAVGIAILFLLQKKWTWLIASASAVCIVVFAASSTPAIREAWQTKLYSSSLRINIWAETVEFLRAHPIAGAGLASYSDRIYRYRIDKWIEVFHHPHNIFLAMWVNLGILGLFAFVWIILWFYTTAIPMRRKTDGQIISLFPYFLISSMTVWLATGLADTPYIKNDLSLLFWLLPALLIATKNDFTHSCE